MGNDNGIGLLLLRKLLPNSNRAASTSSKGGAQPDGGHGSEWGAVAGGDAGGEAGVDVERVVKPAFLGVEQQGVEGSVPHHVRQRVVQDRADVVDLVPGARAA